VGVGVFFSILADLANKVVELFAEIPDETAWKIYDIGNEFFALSGWAIALIITPKLRLKYSQKILIHYMLTVMVTYAVIDIGDEILNANSRPCLPDVVGLAVAIAYGCASFATYLMICRSSHVPVAGSYYRVLHSPKTLIGVLPYLFRKVDMYYMNGNLWVKRKSGWETPVKHRIREGVVLRYCGNGKKLLESVTNGMEGN